jgi:hypothetical protein
MQASSPQKVQLPCRLADTGDNEEAIADGAREIVVDGEFAVAPALAAPTPTRCSLSRKRALRQALRRVE